MSLSGALSNAMSGLAANARGTSVISANIANALNEGYGRRTMNLATDANQSSGGVRVANITRFSDPILAYQKRMAAAEQGKANVQAQAAKDIEQLWGSVDTLGSVAEKLTKLETALLSAAADPSSETRLKLLAQAAEGFAGSIRNAGKGVQFLRTQADAFIASSVEQMNSGLQRLESLNEKIVSATYLGQDTLSLQDQRATELDRLSQFVPLHVVERESGAIAVFSSQGRTLLDRNAVEFSFEANAPVLAHMTQANGLLSSLLADGQVVDAGNKGMLSGGMLSAHFDVRDVSAISAQTRIDAIARDVIERFGSNGPDGTLDSSDMGVFTDGGTTFDPINQTGVSERIQVNSALQSSSTELWRWRDGIMASAPGAEGENSLLMSLKAQITDTLPASSPMLETSADSLLNYIQSYSSIVAAERVKNEDSLDFARNQFSNISELVASNGVNTDQELQKLIELEKSYAANARVVRVVDDMLSELLRI
jgi:flagellar hook-associated protein 1 FlgK